MINNINLISDPNKYGTLQTPNDQNTLHSTLHTLIGGGLNNTQSQKTF